MDSTHSSRTALITLPQCYQYTLPKFYNIQNNIVLLIDHNALVENGIIIVVVGVFVLVVVVVANSLGCIPSILAVRISSALGQHHTRF